MRESFFFLFMNAFIVSIIFRLISYIVEEGIIFLKKEQSKKTFSNLVLNINLRKFIEDYERGKYQKSEIDLNNIEFYSRIGILMSELGIILTVYDFALAMLFFIHFIWYGINTIIFIKNKKF